MHKNDIILKLAGKFLRLAVPFESGLLESLHDPDLRAALTKQSVIVYHGTSSKKLAKILQHGSLDPETSQEFKTFPEATQGIFVSKRIIGFGSSAELYANVSAERDGSDPVILELVIPLSWIQVDPDDTRLLEETKELNLAGKAQGMVTRSINIKHIKGVILQGKQINQVAPGEQSGIFDSNKTQMLPIGVMLDKIKTAIKKGIQLPEEYHEMVNLRPRGLTRHPPPSELPEKVAMGLTNLYDNIWAPGGTAPSGRPIYDEALLYILRNPHQIYGSAISAIQGFLEKIGESYQILEESGWGMPTSGENLLKYLKRLHLL